MSAERRSSTPDGPSPVIWFEIWVADLERAEAFYAALLGWTFRPFEEYDPVNYHIVATPDGTLGGALVRIQAPPKHGTADDSGTVVYAAVDDLEAAVDGARSLGGSVIQPPRVIGSADGQFAIVSDPDGNRVGLMGIELVYGARRLYRLTDRPREQRALVTG